MLSGGEKMLIILILLILLAAIMILALPKAICPKCGNKVLIMHNGSGLECEKCKTKFIIDKETNQVKEILN